MLFSHDGGTSHFVYISIQAEKGNESSFGGTARLGGRSFREAVANSAKTVLGVKGVRFFNTDK
ncbi:hypothetical protein RCO48_02050 [Peribacillus frigoritolerans]|nr:hypothetical protein [Peribacillus frigoritolerans]